MSYQHPWAPPGAKRRYLRRVLRVDYSDPAYRSGGIFGVPEQSVVVWEDLDNGLSVLDVLKYEAWLAAHESTTQPEPEHAAEPVWEYGVVPRSHAGGWVPELAKRVPAVPAGPWLPLHQEGAET